MPKALCNNLSVGPITSAPVMTPIISAVCCILGVVPTICPVFKSCITSPAMAADDATIEAINIVASINVGVDNPNIKSPIIHTRATVNNSVAIVMPDTGELDEPTTPAIYPYGSEEECSNCQEGSTGKR